MRIFGETLGERVRRVDPVLLFSSLALSLISIVTIFGAVDNFGRSKLIMQIAMTAAGILLLFVIANLDYRYVVEGLWIYMLIGSVLLLLVTLIFGQSGENMETGNQSWLRIPIINIAIQPSEFVKITFLCTFAKHIDTVKGKLNRPTTVVGLLIHAGLFVGLILLSGDLGVALVYIGIILFMLFCAGLSGWYFLGGGVAALIAIPILWEFLKPYQQNRILYGFFPEQGPADIVRQPLMSREAISQGGLFGKGLFEGGIYEDLAASHTDFIFATVCEKFGFVGGFLVVACLVVMAVRLLWIALRCRDTVGKLICAGIAAVIIFQTLENLWMCLAMVPVIGITLPFVSAGGSSMLALYMMMGIAHSVSAHEKRSYFRATYSL